MSSDGNFGTIEGSISGDNADPIESAKDTQDPPSAASDGDGEHGVFYYFGKSEKDRKITNELRFLGSGALGGTRKFQKHRSSSPIQEP